MSVLNQCGEEQVECPLCMEPLEVDDLNFFPCTCGYQICRFCWHRIRTDENGLCPACRKAYSENPADFTPLSKEQVAQLKAEKRQRDQQRKAKLSESRKHLASVRVVQRNLVFVVGLPMRLADPEVLKRHEYFGKFGKIHKVVINQSSAYAGTQGPSASAYVTYIKSDDALRAIQAVNNSTLDGKTIKTSLGTTKYCSHFMKNQACPKVECMYLHDFGDQEASFTKEDMHAGKHQEYEKKLHDALLSKHMNGTCSASSSSTAKTKETTCNGSNWPQLEGSKHETTTKTSSNNNRHEGGKKGKKKQQQVDVVNQKNKKLADRDVTHEANNNNNNNNNIPKMMTLIEEAVQNLVVDEKQKQEKKSVEIVDGRAGDDNTSFFTQNTFACCAKVSPPPSTTTTTPQEDEATGRGGLLDRHHDPLLDIDDSERWTFDFGYTNHSNHLEELATQRGGDFNVLDTFNNPPSPPPATTDHLLDALVSYPPQRHIFNGHKDALHEQQGGGNAFPKIFDFYRNILTPGHQQQQMLHNGFHTPFVQQQQYNQISLMDKHLALVAQQQQMEESLMNMTLQPADIFQGHYVPKVVNKVVRPTTTTTIEDKDLDYRFQEAQKALEALVESDTQHMHSAGGGAPRKNVATTHNPVNGLAHSQSGTHLPPPPPGFVQPATTQTTHMNSFGSKILPYLSLNNQQQQQQQLNTWPSNYSHIQQQQQHKGISVCNDWKILDPAILSSGRRIPTMGPLMEQQPYAGQTSLSGGVPIGGQTSLQAARNYDLYTLSNYTNSSSSSTPLQHSTSFNNAHTLGAQPNRNWLAPDLNTHISTPPGFRSTGQTNKQQQEC